MNRLAASVRDPQAFGKVAVLMGGTSAERQISLMSGGGVLQALRSQGVDAHAFDPAERELAELKREGFARCFIALHGRHGEDGSVQGALELLGIPYTGSGVLASAMALDKVMTKRVWLAEGLPTPRYVWLTPENQSRERVRSVPDELGLPLIVKPPREGSSIGVSKVEGYSQMQAAVELATRYDPDLLCEEFIDGEEVTCPVLGQGAAAVALPVIRIQAPQGAYDYQNKYFTDVVQYQCPSGLPEAEEREIQRIVVQAYRTLGCRGWGRADLMIRRADRKAFLLEINTSPGMTSHSLVPMSARATSSSACCCSKVPRWTRRIRRRPSRPIRRGPSDCHGRDERLQPRAAAGRASDERDRQRAVGHRRGGAGRVGDDVGVAPTDVRGALHPHRRRRHAQQRLDDSRQCVAQVGGQLLHDGSGRRPPRLRVGAVGAPCGGQPHLAEPAGGSPGRAPRRGTVGQG
jgi:D-alanine-D-alanine ligase